MIRAPLLLTLALAATAFSGCLLDSTSNLTIEGPRWSSGYSHSYLMTGNVHLVEEENGRSDTRTEEFPPFAYVSEVLNTGYRTQGERVYLLAVTQSFMEDVDAYSESGSMSFASAGGASLGAMRARDLGPVPVSYDLDSECDENPDGETCALAVSDLSFGPGPEITYLDFPLKEGKSWAGTITFDSGPMDEDEFGMFEWDVRAQVAGPTSLGLPVGRTEAMRVDYLYTPIGIEAWKEDIRQGLEREGFDVQLLEYNVALRERVYYADAYQTVVRSEVTSTMVARISATAPDGEDFSGAITLNMNFVTELQGASLVPKPERGLDYIGKVLFGQLPVNDPTGNQIRPAGYTIDLTADKYVVNSAEEETVNFLAQVIGVDQLPGGHAATWRITDSEAHEVAAGDGLAFAYSFTEPGAYGIEVEVRDADGAVTAAGGDSVVANWEKTLQLDCTPVAVQPFTFLSSCDDAAIPVRLGIQSLAIEAQPSSIVAAVNSGQLRVTDGFQHTDSTPSSGGQKATLQIDDFAGYGVTGDDWMVEWYQNRGVLETVTLTVSLGYEARIVEIAAEPETSPLDVLLQAFKLPAEFTVMQAPALPVDGVEAGDVLSVLD